MTILTPQRYEEIPADALHILRGFFHILPKIAIKRVQTNTCIQAAERERFI
jgi:hypothetical protein